MFSAFNVRVSLLYFLLTALSVVAISLTVGQGRKDAVRQAERSLEVIPAEFEAYKELRERRLSEYAARVASSEVESILQLLRDFRKDFGDVDRLICSDEDGGVPCDPARPSVPADRAQRADLADARFGETVFKSFADSWITLVRARRTLDEAGARVLAASVRKRLGECFGWGSTRCDWEFSHESLLAAKDAIKREVGVSGTPAPSLVMVFDAQGIGLAHGQNDRWSYRPEFAETVLRVKPLVEPPPATEVPPTYFDIMRFEDTSDVEFLVAIVPIIGPDRKFAGAVLVADPIDLKFVDADRRLFDRDATYILGDKVLNSTLEGDDIAVMQGSAAPGDRTTLLSNDTWMGVSLPVFSTPVIVPGGDTKTQVAIVGGNAYGPRYQTLRVVLASPVSRVGSVFGQLETLVPIVGIGIFVIGLILFLVIVRNHMRPFEKIDAGIQEVINGNLDYEFPFNFAEELPAGLAQNLNLMLAVLLGKPMPDEVEPQPWGGTWEAGAAPAGGSTNPPPAAGSVDLPVSERSEPGSPDLLKEAAEAYFKRLFDDFRRAREAAGIPDGGLTYVRFVEQLVRTERRIKQTATCKHVRFRVESQAGQVLLVPLLIA